MKQPTHHLVVGIGSAHGDDRAGWHLIDELASRQQASSIRLRKASVPHDMMDWIDNCRTLHIVDACQSTSVIKRIDRSVDPLEVANSIRSGGSHQVGVVDVLKLAESLGRLPKHVILWAIPAMRFTPNEDISESCRLHVEQCAEMMVGDIADT